MTAIITKLNLISPGECQQCGRETWVIDQENICESCDVKRSLYQINQNNTMNDEIKQPEEETPESENEVVEGEGETKEETPE